MSSVKPPKSLIKWSDESRGVICKYAKWWREVLFAYLQIEAAEAFRGVLFAKLQIEAADPFRGVLKNSKQGYKILEKS